MRLSTILAFFLSLLAAPLMAAPTDPVTLSLPPEGQGAIFSPGVRTLPSNYVQEEYFVSGTATLFNYANNLPLGPTDIDRRE